jgi:hypothetical protein
VRRKKSADELRVQLYLAYDMSDVAIKDELMTHLNVLSKREGIDINAEVMPGTNIDEALRLGIEAAHIIVLLLSPDFLSNERLFGLLDKSLERHLNKEAVTWTVLVRDCLWEDLLRNNTVEVLPSNKQPINQWASRDTAYRQIVTAIRYCAEVLKTRYMVFVQQDIIAQQKKEIAQLKHKLLNK